MPIAEPSAGAPAFSFVDPTQHTTPPRRSQVPLLLGAISFVVIVTALISTQRVNQAAVPESRQEPRPATKMPARTQSWVPTGFTPLLAEKDLAGWRAAGNGRNDAWSVAGAELSGSPRSGGDQVLLTEGEFADFELRLQFRWPREGGHTSILLRARDGDIAESMGVPINIGDDEGFPAKHGRAIGRLYETGTILHATFDPPAANKPINQWNDLRVVARGSVVQVEINGIRMPTADFALDNSLLQAHPWYANAKGSIGLVCHWGLIEFRHIAVMELD
jgi:hypothetical protein